MTKFRVLLVVSLMAVSSLAFGQDTVKKGSKEWTDLEKVLWDADQQWLCSSGAGPYHKDIKDCVEFRSKYWADQFFEVGATGKISTKAEMVASQTAGIPTHVPGVGPYPSGEFQADGGLRKLRDGNGSHAFQERRCQWQGQLHVGSHLSKTVCEGGRKVEACSWGGCSNRCAEVSANTSPYSCDADASRLRHFLIWNHVIGSRR
jgi:hypothetical protein